MHPETLIFGVIPAIFLLSILIAFWRAKGFWRALGAVLWLFPVLLIIGCLVVFGYCEVNKAYWDHKVRQWCEKDGGVTVFEKDGGVTVFEKVELTKEEYEKLNIPFEKIATIDSLYYRASLEDVVINQSPKVWKGGQKIIRQSDGKILGIQTYYGRRGGDFPTGFHPSHYGCEKINSVNLSITSSVFLIKGE